MRHVNECNVVSRKEVTRIVMFKVGRHHHIGAKTGRIGKQIRP
jgi:hypothetical protein